jgi:hypothetical protein
MLENKVVNDALRDIGTYKRDRAGDAAPGRKRYRSTAPATESTSRPGHFALPQLRFNDPCFLRKRQLTGDRDLEWASFSGNEP